MENLCQKVSYDTLVAAATALNKLRGRMGRYESRIYDCAQCGSLHLTSRKIPLQPPLLRTTDKVRQLTGEECQTWIWKLTKR